jgi:hypothetical protein
VQGRSTERRKEVKYGGADGHCSPRLDRVRAGFRNRLSEDRHHTAEAQPDALDSGRVPTTPLGLLLPPAAAEGFVKLHEALELVAAILREGQLGVEKRALVVEDLEVGGDAAAVALE